MGPRSGHQVKKRKTQSRVVQDLEGSAQMLFERVHLTSLLEMLIQHRFSTLKRGV